MKMLQWFGLSMILSAVVFVGCQQQSSKQTNKNINGQPNDAGKGDSKINAALAKLGAEDRKLAESQKICPISKEPLGSMGQPVKITVKDQSVFLCCKACEKDALADAEKTLATVKQLKAKSQK